MVLESILNFSTARKRPWDTFLMGVLYTTISLFVSYFIFEEYASIIMVFLTTLAAVPLFYTTINSEEKTDIQLSTENSILREHFRVILFLMFFFAGATTSLALWYTFLPSGMVEKIFTSQLTTLVNIDNSISGAVTQPGSFIQILLNNVHVLTITFFFSLIYGVGALFILVWNAAVIGAAIGHIIRSGFDQLVQYTGVQQIGSYITIFSSGFLRYIIHGPAEILAYFVGALAGGILSVAIVRKDVFGKKRKRIVRDITELLVIAFSLVFIAALVEVYIVPMLIG